MDLGISGRTALVHGAGGGLGRAIALSLAREGAKVAVADLHRERAEETAAEMTKVGGRALPLSWDLGDLASIGPHNDHIERALGIGR